MFFCAMIEPSVNNSTAINQYCQLQHYRSKICKQHIGHTRHSKDVATFVRGRLRFFSPQKNNIVMLCQVFEIGHTCKTSKGAQNL